MQEFTAIDGERKSTINSSQLEDFFTSYQLNHNPNSPESCPLCKIKPAEEHIHSNSEGFLILDTRYKKGHKERIMLLTKKHGVQHPKKLLKEAIQKLITVGGKVFNSDFILLSDRFSSTRYHWHIVASDLDPTAEDYQQILETPFILITTEKGSNL